YTASLKSFTNYKAIMRPAGSHQSRQRKTILKGGIKMSFRDLQEKYKATRKKYEDAKSKYIKELHQYDDLLEKDLEKFVDIDMGLRKKHGIDELQKELIEVEKELIEKGKNA